MAKRLAALLLLAATSGCGYVAGDRLSDAQQVVGDVKFGVTKLEINGAADPPDRRYRVGDTVNLMVQVNKPAYVAVLRVSQGGGTTLIFPNRLQKDPRVLPNTPVRIPPAGLSAPLPQAGTVLFKFIASERAGSWLFTRQSSSGDVAELGTTTREIARDILSSLKPGVGDPPAVSHIVINVAGE